jgi:ankyrin repeat protein
MSAFLLENGADIHMPTCEYFQSALQGAASCGHLETIRSLVEYGADVNSGGPVGMLPCTNCTMDVPLESLLTFLCN